MKKWKKTACLFLSLLTLLSFTGCQQQNSIRFGAAGLGGNYYAFATAFSELCAAQDEPYTIDVKSTAGSAANIRLLNSNYIELGIAQMDLVDEAYHGTGAYEKAACQGYQAIASLYTEVCQIVVRADSSIHSLADLQGKTVSIGEAESGTERNAKQILSLSGLNDKLVDMVNLDYTEAATALATEKIDAAFFTAGLHLAALEGLSDDCAIRFLAIDDTCAQKLKAAYPFYEDVTIPANTYRGQDEDISSLGIPAVLLANETLSDDTVKQLTSFLFAHAKDLQYSLSMDLRITEATAVKGITIPFHAGAAEYYKENGIDVTKE